MHSRTRTLPDLVELKDQSVLMYYSVTIDWWIDHILS